jgi:hypothetical protein
LPEKKGNNRRQGLRLQGAIRVMARLRSPMAFLYETLLQQKKLIEGVLKTRR